MADGSLIFDTKIDGKGFQDGMSKLKSTGTTAMKVVAKGIVATGAALTAMGGYTLKASIDFESAFAGVRKTIDATEAEFAMLEKGIRDMSKKMPQSASDIAEVAEAAGQLGIKTENILGFTETMVMLGDATNMSSDQAATALARLANITGMSQTDFDRLGSAIVELGNNLATTEGEIVEMGLRLAGTASQVGLTEHEILALAGAMSSVGINAEAGGSSMSRVMQKMNTEVLSGGKNLSKFAEISGMSSDEFSKAWKDKPAEAITTFINGLDEVNASGGDVTTMLKELGINSVQEIDTLLRLSGASDVLTDALGMSAKAWEENTALADEASQRYETTESMIQILKNNIDDLAKSVGDGLKESFRGGIGTAIEMVQQLADAFEQGGIEGFVEEIGSMLADMLTKVAEFIPKMLDTATNLMLAFISGINNNKEQLIQATLDILQSFLNAFLTVLPEMIVLGIEIIDSFMTGMIDRIPEIVELVIQMFETITQAIINNLPSIMESGMLIIMGLLEGMFELLPMILLFINQLILTFITTLVEHLPSIIEIGMQLIISLIEGLSEALPLLLEGTVEILTTLITGILDNLPLLIEAAIGVVEALIDFIFDNLDMIIDAMLEVVMAMVEGLINNIDRIIEAAFKLMEALITGILDNLPKIVNAGIELILGLVDGLLEMLPTLVGTGIDLIMQLIATIVGLIPRFISVGLQLVGELVIGLVRALPRVLKAGVQLVKAIGRGIKSGFVGIGKIGANLVKGLWEGIKGMGSWIKEKVKGFASGIVNSMKNAFGIKSPSTLMRDVIGKNLTLGIGLGIEEGMPELNRDVDNELTDFTRRMEAVVELETQKTGHRAAGTSTHTTREIIKEEKTGEETPVSGDLYTVIEVEGKEFMRFLTPYMSEELYRLIRRGY